MRFPLTRLLAGLFLVLSIMGCVSSSSFEGYTAAVDKRFAAIEDRVSANSSATGSRFASTDRQVANLREELTQIEGTLSSLRQDLILLRESNRDFKADVQERIDGAEQKVKELGDRVGELRLGLIKLTSGRRDS